MDNYYLEYYKNDLINFARTEAGRYLLGVKNDFEIVNITPNSIHFSPDSSGMNIIAQIWQNNQVVDVLSPYIEQIRICNSYKDIDDPYEAFLHYSGLEVKNCKYPQVYLDTKVFQPSDTTSKDTYLSKFNNTTNYGTENVIVMQPYSTATYIKRPLLQFDVSSIFPNTSTDSGSVSLYLYEVTGAATVTAEVHSITRTWTKLGATWDKYDGTSAWTTAGGDFGTAVLGTASVGTTGVFYNMAVPGTLISAWKTTNNGILIKSDNENQSVNNRSFASSRFGTAANRPYLTVAYTPTASTIYLINRNRDRFRRTGVSAG